MPPDQGNSGERIAGVYINSVSPEENVRRGINEG